MKIKFALPGSKPKRELSEVVDRMVILTALSDCRLPLPSVWCISKWISSVNITDSAVCEKKERGWESPGHSLSPITITITIDTPFALIIAIDFKLCIQTDCSLFTANADGDAFDRLGKSLADVCVCVRLAP